MSLKPKASLYGPFVGDLFYEMFVFAPHVIFKKLLDPEKFVIVYTRPSRFDLYGTYANIFVPFKVEERYMADHYKLKILSHERYQKHITIFHSSYLKKYEIEEHLYPDISSWRYNIKWQFPRDEVSYLFSPRKQNLIEVEKYLNGLENFIVVDLEKNLKDEPQTYNYIYIKDFTKHFLIEKHFDISMIGLLIELMRKSEFVVGNLSSTYSRLALLLNKPLISINEKLSVDAISLINPMNTPVINCFDISKGVEIYENNFRS